MPFVRIDVLEGRPRERLKVLISRVTDTVAEVLETPRERVRVVVTEVPRDLWGIGGVPASEVRADGER
jgi:4-oxalocrotonate tautomerase